MYGLAQQSDLLKRQQCTSKDEIEKQLPAFKWNTVQRGKLYIVGLYILGMKKQKPPPTSFYFPTPSPNSVKNIRTLRHGIEPVRVKTY